MFSLISGGHWCTKTLHQYGVSIQSSTKVRETFWQITQKLLTTKTWELDELFIYSLLKHFIFLASSTGRFPIYFWLRDSENDLYWKPNNAFSRSTWDGILRNPRKNCFVSTLNLKKILPFTFVPLRLKELPTFHNFPKLQCYSYNRKSLFHRSLYCPNALWVRLRPCYPCRKFERLNHLLKDEVFLIGANIMNKASRYKM